MNFKNIYKESVDILDPSPELINKIKSGKEKKIIMFSKKKAAVVAAIACMVLGTTVFAAGRITSYSSWSNPQAADGDYSGVEKYIEQNDIKAAIPESLSTGYTFSNSNTGGTKGEDENGNLVAEGEFFQVIYSKEGAPDLYLNVDPILQAEDHSNSTEAREVNGVTVYYNKDTYKFVPTDYEYSEEDKANEEAGHFYVSYGSDEVNVQSVDNIVFELDGKSYNMLSFDNSMSVDEWFAIAEEIIK